MASSDYTLHFNSLTGEWEKIPYDSSSSSDVGTSGWYSTVAATAGVPNPQKQDMTPIVIAAVGGGLLLAIVLSGRR